MAREDGTVTEQPVIFATDHEPAVADLVQITLQSGKQITATDHHMMVVRGDNGEFKLKLAALVEPGDVFCSKNTTANDVVEDRVTEIKRYSSFCLAVNILIADGYLLVNDVVSSHRTYNDFSDTLKMIGELIYLLLGLQAVI